MVDRLRLGRRGVSHISSSLIVHIIYVVYYLHNQKKNNYKYIPSLDIYISFMGIYIYIVPSRYAIYVHLPSAH